MEMIEKVIKRLEYCIENKCDICQEENGSGFPWIDGRCYGFTERLYDVLALLKVQEPRLVTELDFDGVDEYGYIPVWTEEKDGDMYWECIPKVAITDPDGIGVLRYWTSRPTNEQREETPWN